jgi:hypothetical protein
VNIPDAKATSEFLRQKEMQELIASEKDPITADLMAMAYHVVFMRLMRKETGPVTDFDLRYFMEVIQEFSSQHSILTKLLAGKSGELAWLSDGE